MKLLSLAAGFLARLGEGGARRTLEAVGDELVQARRAVKEKAFIRIGFYNYRNGRYDGRRNKVAKHGRLTGGFLWLVTFMLIVLGLRYLPMMRRGKLMSLVRHHPHPVVTERHDQGQRRLHWEP